MTAIVQVEFRESLLSIRDEILRSLGHPVISARGLRGIPMLHREHFGVSTIRSSRDFPRNSA
jgi:hypothetical protein